METKRVWFPLAVAICMISVTFGFLFDGEQPECIWYGQCGRGWNNGKLNCPADATTKNPPKMTNADGLRILRDYCPALYKGDNNTRTCCSIEQLRIIESSMKLPKTFLGHCPACFYNFVNQVCQMTCSPYQSKFVWANMAHEKPSRYTTGIPGVKYVVTRDFAQGLYDSCADVETFLSIKAIGFLCGKRADKCTPENWLQYLGSVGNGQAPFPIDFVYTDGQPWTAPDGKVLIPLDLQNERCNKPLATSSHVLGKGACLCKECRTAKPCLADPKPTSTTRKQYFDQLFGSGHYQKVEVFIRRADSQDVVVHQIPPPSTDQINFTSIYDKGFLHQVLDLQNAIATMKVNFGGSTISLDDVCYKVANQKACVVESVLQYYQNDAANIDRVVFDQFHIFEMANYLDHYSQCVSDPTVSRDSFPYHLSCKTNFGGVTQPYIVLEGYTGDDYPKATTFVMTFILHTGGSTSNVKAWTNAFISFMGSYNNPNMTISYNPAS